MINDVLIHHLPIDLGDLTLRRLKHTDFADLLTYYSHPDVARYQQWEPMSGEQVQTVLEGQGSVLPGEPGMPLMLAVEHNDNDKVRVIGDCSLTVTDPTNQQAEIGFCFHPLWQGRGYATRTVEAVLRYAFTGLKMHRVVATTDVRNERSWRLLERVAMRREGHLRECAFVKAKWIDNYVFAILAEEWNQRYAEE